MRSSAAHGPYVILMIMYLLDVRTGLPSEPCLAIVPGELIFDRK